MSELAERYESLLTAVKGWATTNPYWEVPDYLAQNPYEYTESELQIVFGAFNRWMYNKRLSVMSNVDANKLEGSYPPGNWHMVTITTPADSTEEVCLQMHEKALECFKYKNIEVFYASLEKSNIWHVHYIVRLPGTTKNLERDLSKACNRYRVQIERKVNSLKSWNGLCKYVMKRDYLAEKQDTAVRVLLQRIQYIEGEGYILTTEP